MQQAAPLEAHVFVGVFALIHIIHGSDEKKLRFWWNKVYYWTLKKRIKINLVFPDRAGGVGGGKATKLFRVGLINAVHTLISRDSIRPKVAPQLAGVDLHFW